MPQILQIPITAGPVCVIYNVPGLSKPLRLSGKTLAGIFAGEIVNWQDPSIVAENPGAKLPHSGIALVHRSDGSGTTSIFTRYLSSTGNSARSIMAEAILKRKGLPNFAAFSAGSHPVGFVHPEAIKQLKAAHLGADGLHSKSWDEFSKPGALPLNFVFTVCDKAAAEICPFWPGQPMTAHWGIPDPAAVKGTLEDVDRAFKEAFAALDRRISLFLCLPIGSLDELALQKEIDQIGRS